MVDKHLEGLSNLLSKGRKRTFSMEFIYKEATTETAAAHGRTMSKRSATGFQKAQRAADAGLWARVYKYSLTFYGGFLGYPASNGALVCDVYLHSDNSHTPGSID